MKSLPAHASVLVVEYGRLPSTDYYILPNVDSFGVPYCLVDSRSRMPDDALLQAGTFVIFVRYVTAPWARAVARVRHRLAGVAYFMDDDLLDPAALSGLPLRYQLKIWRFCLTRRRWLCRLPARLWVSTEYLRVKYVDWQPELIEPVAAPHLMKKQGHIRIFYHGTSAHRMELTWLHPIVRNVQDACEHTSFELIGNASVKRMFSDIPRTTILHPMGWHNYLAYCSAAEHQIGLAPLMDTAFNAGRSTVKFFDITRCGAAGIYSNREPYSSYIRHGEDGLLIETAPDAWEEAILLLVSDRAVRERIASAARERVLHSQPTERR